jgi:hypothetical protein
VGRSFGPFLERLDDHPLDLGIADLARAARARLVVEAVEANAGKASAPAPHRRLVAAKPRRNLLA